MQEYVSLSPSGLTDDFSMEDFSEKPIITVEELEDRIEINFIFPGFTIGDDERQISGETMAFKEIGVSGAGFVSESGRPLMPSFGRFVQIPPGCDYKVSARKNKPVEFEDIIITPAQENATDSADDEEEFEYHADSYTKDVLYPKDVLWVGEAQNLNDYKVLPIHVRPLQYNAAKKTLFGYSNIKVTIKLAQADMDEAEAEEFTFADPGGNVEAYGNLLLNPRRRIAERIRLTRLPGSLVFKPRGPEFLIIYDKKLQKAAQRLADWKMKKGMITKLAPIDRVGNTVPKIKAYIRNQRKYLFSRLRYVLLFGDVGAIVSEERGGNTTDHYYYTKADPAGSSDCLLPWVSGGRIPVGTLTEAQQVVSQIIKYERTPPADSDYYRRMTFAAFFQDNHPQDGKADRAYMKTMEGIRKHMVSLGFSVQRVYVSNNPNPQKYKDGTSVSAAVRGSIMSGTDATNTMISETSEGQLLMGHRDHGGVSGWSHPSFTNSHLASITSDIPSIFYSINCLTGRFDSNPTDSFAEAILQFKGGAPSLVAATELSGTWRNDSLIKALFDAMWPGVISSFPGTTASYAIRHNRLGDILNYAKSYLLVSHGAGSGVKAHFEMYHVVGDPTLQLWAAEPARIRLRAGILRNTLRIQVRPLPAHGMITIWYQGRRVKRMALSSSVLSIPIRELRLEPSTLPPSRRYLYVYASAPGCRFTGARLRF